MEGVLQCCPLTIISNAMIEEHSRPLSLAPCAYRNPCSWIRPSTPHDAQSPVTPAPRFAAPSHQHSKHPPRRALQAVASVTASLKPSGRFCGFSPCIEQIQRTAAALRQHRFTDLQCIECLLRSYDVRKEAVAPLAVGLKEALGGGGGGNAGAVPARGTKRRREGNVPAATDNQHTDAQAGLAPGDAEASCDRTMHECNSDAQPAAAALQDPAACGLRSNGVCQASAEDSAHPGDGEAPAAQQQQQQQEACAAPQAGKRLVAVPSMNARGHTGYLLFARKFVLPQDHGKGSSGAHDGRVVAANAGVSDTQAAGVGGGAALMHDAACATGGNAAGTNGPVPGSMGPSSDA